MALHLEDLEAFKQIYREQEEEAEKLQRQKLELQKQRQDIQAKKLEIERKRIEKQEQETDAHIKKQGNMTGIICVISLVSMLVMVLLEFAVVCLL